MESRLIGKLKGFLQNKDKFPYYIVSLGFGYYDGYGLYSRSYVVTK